MVYVPAIYQLAKDSEAARINMDLPVTHLKGMVTRSSPESPDSFSSDIFAGDFTIKRDTEG
jgi:hypothetical protein